MGDIQEELLQLHITRPNCCIRFIDYICFLNLKSTFYFLIVDRTGTHEELEALLEKEGADLFVDNVSNRDEFFEFNP